MTREQAISWLVAITEHEGEDVPIYDEDVEAINMAIKALAQEPTINDIPQCQYTDEEIAQSFKEDVEAVKDLLPTTKNDLGVDCISRKAVLDAIDSKAWEFCNYLISKGRNDEQKPVSHFADNLRECVREELPSVTQEPQTFKWCTGCREYDQEKHCCHRWTKVIRNTVEEMKQEYIEREVLDKLRVELHATAEMHDDGDYYLREEWIDEYFDKYKAESEDT